MRKLLVVTLALVFALSGCGEDGGSTPSPKPTDGPAQRLSAKLQCETTPVAEVNAAVFDLGSVEQATCPTIGKSFVIFTAKDQASLDKTEELLQADRSGRKSAGPYFYAKGPLWIVADLDGSYSKRVATLATKNLGGEVVEFYFPDPAPSQSP